MGVNEVNFVASTLNGDVARFVPQVSRELKEQMRPYRAMAALEALREAGRGVQVKGQIYQAFEAHPFIVNPVVTQAASAGDTTLYLTETRFLRRDTIIFDPTSSKETRVTADPVIDGQVSVTALESGIAVGSHVISHISTLPEGWLRPSPVSRNVEHFTEAVMTIKHAWSDTWHSQFYEVYYGSEEERARRQAENEFLRAGNAALYLSRFRNGTVTGAADGDTRIRGLLQRGEETNLHGINGILHLDDLYDILYSLYANRSMDGPPTVRIHCSQKLINETSFWAALQTNLQTKIGDTQLGTQTPNIVNPMGIDMRWAPDQLFDEAPELEGTVLLVDWAQVYPLTFGTDFTISPTKEHMEGIADRGGGVREWMMVKSLGMAARTQYFAVIALKGVTRITI